jgi:hypothetical protein
LKNLDLNYNNEIFLICNEIKELIIFININYEEYSKNLGNKQLIIIIMQEINILNNVDTKIEVLNETLTNILLNYDKINNKQNLVKSKLDKHVQQVK